MDSLKVMIREKYLDTLGYWAGPQNLFPQISIDQDTGAVEITYFSNWNDDLKLWGKTHDHVERFSADHRVVMISGMTGLKNGRRKIGGRQKFIFAVTLEEKGKISVHRTRATQGWLSCSPNDFWSRMCRLEKSGKPVV
jgi:hypothetical protein